MHTRVLAVVLALLAVGGARPSAADTYVVRPDGTGDFPTIQAAINHATGGDIIELTEGVFLGAGNRDLDYGGKAIIIRSAGGNPDLCILDCQGSDQDPHRAVAFSRGEGGNSVLQGVTIRNGLVAAPDPSNPASWGGAALVTNQSGPTFLDIVFVNNTAVVGGGVAIWEGGAVFTRCRFIGNLGWWGTGGGIWARHSSVLAEDCVFEANRGHQAGGGATFGSSSDVTLRHCWFERNQVDSGYGAGLDVAFSTVGRVEDCTFLDNFSDSFVFGAGFYCTSASATLERCTFVGNRANQGGAIGIDMSAVITVDNALIAFNLGGGAVHCNQGTANLTCCDIYGNAGGDWVGCIAAQHGTAGNITADPLLCDVVNGDFTLHADSPCAPENSPAGCGLIGAWPVGCGATAVESETWGGIKARFR